MTSKQSTHLFYMIALVVVLLITATLFASSCTPPSNASRSSPTAVPSSSPSQTPSPSATLTPTYTSTPTPTHTSTSTPTPIPITLENWHDLEVLSTIGDGEVVNIQWSSGGTFLLVGLSHSISLYERSGDWSLISKVETVGRLSNAALNPEGSQFAAGVWQDNFDTLSEVRVWDAQTGQVVHQFPIDEEHGVYDAFYSPDGRLFATKGFNHTLIWETSTWSLLHSLHGGNGPFSFSPDAHYIALSTGQRVTVFDILDTSPREVLEVWHSADVTDVDFSHDGTILAVTRANGEFSFWDVPNPRYQGGVLRNSFARQLWSYAEECDTEHPRCYDLHIAFSPDGATIATVRPNPDTGTFGWEVAITTFPDLTTVWHRTIPHRANDLAFSPDGRTIAAGGVGTVTLLTSSNGYVAREFTFSSYPAYACMSRDDLAQLLEPAWGPSTYGPSTLQEFMKHPNPAVVSDFALPPHLIDGDYANEELWTYAVSDDHSMIGISISPHGPNTTHRFLLVDRPVDLSRAVLEYHSHDINSWINAVAFNYDSSLVTISEGRSLLTWDIPSGQLLSTVEIPDVHNVSDLIYSRGGMLIAIDSKGFLHFIDPTAGRWLGKLPSLSNVAGSLLLSPDGSELALATCLGAGQLPFDRVVLIWGLQ